MALVFAFQKCAWTTHMVHVSPLTQAPTPARADSSLPALVLLSAVHGLKNPHSHIRMIIILLQQSAVESARRDTDRGIISTTLPKDSRSPCVGEVDRSKCSRKPSKTPHGGVSS